MSKSVYAWRSIAPPARNLSATNEVMKLNLWLADRIGYKLRRTNKFTEFPEYEEYLILTNPDNKDWELRFNANSTWEEAMWECLNRGFISRWTNNVEDAMKLAQNYPNIQIENTNDRGWNVACWDDQTILYSAENISPKHLPIHLVCCVLALTDLTLASDAVYPPEIAPSTEKYKPLQVDFSVYKD